MIDTDKYEGHTPAPWVWMEWNAWLAGGNEDGFLGKFLVERPIEVADEDKVDGLLIADAPLLLAEVKRLRDALRIARDSLVWSDEDFIVDEAFAEQIESVRDNIAQVLED